MQKDALRGFETHGVTFRGTAGNQHIGDCPFCGKGGHFYANETNKLWDCKRCGEKGNFPQFLELVAKNNGEALTEKRWQALCLDRGLPKSAFEGHGVGWSDSVDGYTIPVRDIQGRVTDLRIYKLGKKVQATSTANLGLLWAQDLSKHALVYVCEGEWDGFAFRWLLHKLKKEGVVVAVPGASVFKKEWIPWFANKKVVTLYDNDPAGEQGQKSLVEKLMGTVESLRGITWPSGLPEGYDVRDHVQTLAIKEKRPKWAFNKLLNMVGSLSKSVAQPSQATPEKSPSENGNSPPLNPASATEAIEAYRKWLHLPDDEVLQVMFGAALANKLQGDPIWLFLVAPPGGSKSELLSSISRSPLVESTTSLTPHSLVSGAHFLNGSDPSLIPKLDGKILVIKDFTTILSMHYTSRDEIFGVLRDIYDGRTEKTFGTGIKRAYVSHFGIIAGVTPKIEEFGVVHQSLGERFLKYRINTGQKTLSEADRIRRALRNINSENAMRDELCKIGNRCLAIPIPERLPTVPEEIFEYVVNLAQVTAMMRGVVERDRWSGQVMYKPAIEVGTRLAKQLLKLALGIAIYVGKTAVDWTTYRLIRKVALDTAPDRVEEIVRRLYQLCPTKNDAAKTNDVSARTRLPVSTCFRILQDLELLKLVDRRGKGTKYEWVLGEKLQRLIRDSKLFDEDRRTVLR